MLTIGNSCFDRRFRDRLRRGAPHGLPAGAAAAALRVPRVHTTLPHLLLRSPDLFFLGRLCSLVPVRSLCALLTRSHRFSPPVVASRILCTTDILGETVVEIPVHGPPAPIAVPGFAPSGPVPSAARFVRVTMTEVMEAWVNHALHQVQARLQKNTWASVLRGVRHLGLRYF